MSAQLAQMVKFRPMEVSDLDAVMEIEPRIYSHPWTRGNFNDSLKAGYLALMMLQGEAVVGYALMMMVLDEAHLLNISVAKAFQKQGFGKQMLNKMLDEAKAQGAANMFLEVRQSNQAAIMLYECAGFNEMAIRRKYYPAETGREDAVLMGLAL